MLFVVIVSWTLIVESASIALLALIFSTYFFPLCLNFLSRQDELFCHVTPLLYPFWPFLKKRQKNVEIKNEDGPRMDLNKDIPDGQK